MSIFLMRHSFGLPLENCPKLVWGLERNGDLIRHTVHWHEPPVITRGFALTRLVGFAKLLRQTDDDDDDEVPLTKGQDSADDGDVLWIINKPATVPCHPQGCYLANSLLPMVETRGCVLPKIAIVLCCKSIWSHASLSLIAG